MPRFTLYDYARCYLLPIPYLEKLGCKTLLSGVSIPYFFEEKGKPIVKRVTRFENDYWMYAGSYFKSCPLHIIYGKWRQKDYWNDHLIIAHTEVEAQILWYAGFQAISSPFMFDIETLYREGIERFKCIYFYNTPDEFKTISKSSFKDQAYYMTGITRIDDVLQWAGGSINEFSAIIKQAMTHAKRIEQLEPAPTEDKKQ